MQQGPSPRCSQTTLPWVAQLWVGTCRHLLVWDFSCMFHSATNRAQEQLSITQPLQADLHLLHLLEGELGSLLGHSLRSELGSHHKRMHL